MKNFTLAVYARRKGDGSYDYSLKVWENRSAATLCPAKNPESRTLTTPHLDSAWPVRADRNLVGSDFESADDYWYRFTLPMSEEQAANLGWRGNSAPEESVAN